MKAVLLTVGLFSVLQLMLSYNFTSQRTDIYIGPSKNIKNYTFGYDDFMASLMWVRVVQDFHVCDQSQAKVKYPEFQKNKDPLEDILTRELPQSRCENGWVYQMLDVITDLQPNYKAAYLDGATMLSVLVDDREGAQNIFKKGILVFPEDWDLLYRAAYHAMFEMQDVKAAQDLMLRAAQRGAPKWVYALYGKLMDRTGQAALAISVLEQVLDRDLGGTYTSRIEAQINRLKKAIEQPKK